MQDTDSDADTCKRQRHASEWTLTFHQTHAFRTLIDVVANIIGRVNVKIKKGDDDDGFAGISVESIDPKRVCLIAAKLACDVTAEDLEPDMCFCVDTQTLGTCLRSASPNYSIDISKTRESDEIVLRTYETICSSYISHFRLPTLAHDDEVVKLTGIDYNYVIEFDLGTLRSIVRNCIALKGENVTLQVEEPKTEDKQYQTTRLTIRSEGNAEQVHVFTSRTARSEIQETPDKENAGHEPVIIKTITSDDAAGDDDVNGAFVDMKSLYKETFSASYLNLFMKNMDRTCITMRLAPNKPLVLSYPLGVEQSNICFVLAAKVDD